MLAYKLDLLRRGLDSGEDFIQTSDQASLPRLLATTRDPSAASDVDIRFDFLLFPGSYRVRARLCQVGGRKKVKYFSFPIKLNICF